jgi:drug/metabolite transporter (DMT)-like permease
MDRTKNFFQKPVAIVLLAALCCILWGSAYPCVKIGYELFQIGEDDVFAKLLFAGYRFALAGVMVIIAASVLNKRFAVPKKHNWIGVAVFGLVQTTLQYIFFYIGLSHTTGVKGSVLNSVGTFIAVILAHFIYQNDRLNWTKGIGCLIGFSGVVLINLGGDISGGFTFTGEGFIILAAITFAVSFIICKAMSAREEAMTLTGYNLLIGGVVLIVIGICGGAKLTYFTWQSSGLLLYMALLSAVAFTLWTLLLKYNRVGKISVYNFLVPVFGVILSAVFLGENAWSIQNLAALILVCAGIYIVNRRKELQLEQVQEGDNND